MAKLKTRYWFAACRSNRGIVDYVISALTLIKAQESMGCLSKDYDIYPLNWDLLHRLTGCVVPSFVSRGAVATGDLLFPREGGHFVIRYAKD